MIRIVVLKLLEKKIKIWKICNFISFKQVCMILIMMLYTYLRCQNIGVLKKV